MPATTDARHDWCKWQNAAAQRLMAPHRAADANDDFMPHAAVKLVHMAPDDQCLYRSVLAALEDIGHNQLASTDIMCVPYFFSVRRLHFPIK